MVSSSYFLVTFDNFSDNTESPSLTILLQLFSVHSLSVLQDVTLSELMDEDELLQECKAQNKKLIDL